MVPLVEEVVGEVEVDDDEVVELLSLVLVVLVEDDEDDVDEVEEDEPDDEEPELLTSTAVPPFAGMAYTENALDPPHISDGYPKHVDEHALDVACEPAGLSFPQ